MEKVLQKDKEEIIKNYYRAIHSLTEIGTTNNISDELMGLCIDASRATVKIINYINDNR